MQRSRKIVVVVHSLGGLLLKDALFDSANEPTVLRRQLHENTIAIAFLGTPHRGSGFAPYASLAAELLSRSGKRVNKDILRVLKKDDPILSGIEKHFGNWLRNTQARVTLACFFEELQLPGVGMVSMAAPFQRWHIDLHRTENSSDLSRRSCLKTQPRFQDILPFPFMRTIW
jgi:protein SERAC1